MGSSNSKHTNDGNNDIAKHMKKQIKQDNKVKKMLILGSGSVGKTTIFKSILISYIENYFDKPVNEICCGEYESYVRSNCHLAMMTLLKQSIYLHESYNAADTQYNDENLLKCHVPIEDGDDNMITKSVQTLVSARDENFNDTIDYTEIRNAISKLWKLDSIQQVYKQRMKKKYWFMENMKHFNDQIEYVMSSTYKRNIEDYLKVKIRTTGIIEQQYTDKSGNMYVLFDVGGERNERKKWIQVFENVSCILYVCGLNQFCLAMFEDESVLGLNENLMLWKEISSSKWFQRGTKFVVLLNKCDLFRQFLMYTPLTFCFGDEYKGRNYKDFPVEKSNIIFKRIVSEVIVDIKDVIIPDDVIYLIQIFCDDLRNDIWLDYVYQDGIEFIRNKYLEMAPNALIYEVSAIDTKQVNEILDDIHIQLHLE